MELELATIEDQLPGGWRDLQEKVAQILHECGMDAQTDKQLEIVRGTVNVDVFAEDTSQTPPVIYLCECKRWGKRVTKTVVHSLRSVVSDFGANWGFIISSGGFQSGAYEASQYSNIRLLHWLEFQAMFEHKWIDNYFARRIHEEADALIEYTEPLNSRIFRKASFLPKDAQRAFRVLRDKYRALGYLALKIWFTVTDHEGTLLEPPAKEGPAAKTQLSAGELPSDLLEAKSYRAFLDTYIKHARRATAEFDEVFGERA